MAIIYYVAHKESQNESTIPHFDNFDISEQRRIILAQSQLDLLTCTVTILAILILVILFTVLVNCQKWRPYCISLLAF